MKILLMRSSFRDHLCDNISVHILACMKEIWDSVSLASPIEDTTASQIHASRLTQVNRSPHRDYSKHNDAVN